MVLCKRFRQLKTTPGIERNNRIDDEGLERLQVQLQNGRKISQPVLNQWIKRYGDKAKILIAKHNSS